MTKKIIVIGGGGHAEVLIEVVKECNADIIGYIAKEKSSLSKKIKFLGDDKEITNYSPEKVLLVNAIGSVGSVKNRKKIFKNLKKHGYRFKTLIHRTAVVSPKAIIGEGVQVMAGSIIQTGCTIGDNVIINTGSIIDHDCFIGNHTHIAPGATLSGGISVLESTHVGTGATVIQNIHIGKNSVIGAGSVVIENVPDNVTVVGVPASRVLLPAA